MDKLHKNLLDKDILAILMGEKRLPKAPYMVIIDAINNNINCAGKRLGLAQTLIMMTNEPINIAPPRTIAITPTIQPAGIGGIGYSNEAIQPIDAIVAVFLTKTIYLLLFVPFDNIK